MSKRVANGLGVVRLGETREIASRSGRGTGMLGLIDTPAEFTAACRAPTLLRVHGGPDGQHRHAVGFDHQLLAALFRGGDKDFNVSLVSGKQMYHASRVLGGPTRRLVYPGE